VKNTMKMTMKNLVPLLTLILGLNANAAVYLLSEQGLTGRYCVGNTLNFDLQGEYLERMVVSAEGVSRDGFIKVYADGELIHNIGVPGYDPDYSFRVRRSVENITFKFERTCSIIHEASFFTKDHQGDYRHRDGGFMSFFSTDYNWGQPLLEMVNSLSNILIFRADYPHTIWPKILLPLKKLAIAQSSRAVQGMPKKLEMAYYSLLIAQKITQEMSFFSSLLLDQRFDGIVHDLLNMRSDILDYYDVTEWELPSQLALLRDLLQVK